MLLGRGLYRMPAVPVTSLDAYVEAVLCSGHQGVLSHEIALDLYELCDVNPVAIVTRLPRHCGSAERHTADLPMLILRICRDSEACPPP